MKTTTLTFNTTLLLILGLLVSSCISNVEFKEINKRYANKYELRKFNIKNTSSTEASGWFFIIVGGYNSKTTELSNARMYFKNYMEQYEFLEMPLNKVRIKIDSLVTIPYITFVYDKNDFNNAVYDNDVCSETYVKFMKRIIIHCKESDFMPEINIADLK